MTDLLQHLRRALAERYAVERELGVGGMAVVFLAEDLKHCRRVAVKVLKPELGQSLGADRFLREIEVAAQLTHPHILPLFDSGAAGELLYYVTPYVEGESLQARLEREGQLALDVTLRLAGQVAQALGYAHDRGIVHRDIKPANILLESGQAVVADYGLALALSAAGGERLTESGLALGTPAYLSPEQAAGDRHLDGRADLYSLACVIYEMLAGEPPFTGPTAQAIVAKRFAGPAPRISVVRDGVPPAVDHAIARGLARAPADRFATAAEFARALNAPEIAAPRRPRAGLRRWGAITGLVALTAGAFLLQRSRPPAPPIDPNLLAVAPFDVLDPSLKLWQEGMVDILSRNLDGAGPLRTLPQTVGIKRWRGRADRVSAERFGRRNRAGLVVFGSVRKSKDTVSLRATLLDLTRSQVEPDLEVKGDTARIGDLADSLGLKVLQLLGRYRPIGSVRQLSLGSRSLSALKAFLSGEQFYRRGIWDSAVVYYDRATTLDSTFAIAFKQLGSAVDWHPVNEESYLEGVDYLRKAVVLNHRLSLKDSIQLAADSFWIAAEDATDPADRIRFTYRWVSTLEQATRSYPDDPEVWYRLGDARFHQHPPLGGTPAQALEIFQRAIAADSGFAPAYEHTVHLAIRLNRADLARKYAAEYLRLDPAGINAPPIRLAALMLDPGRSHTPEVARLIDTTTTEVLFAAGNDHLQWWTDSADGGVRLFRAMSRRCRSGRDPFTDSLMTDQILAGRLAYRGHLREAFETDRPLIFDPSASHLTSFMDPFLSLSLLGAIPESLASATFRRAFQPGSWPIPPFNNPARQLQGLPWWLEQGDTVSLARFAVRAEQEGRTQPSATGKLRGRYLHRAATAYLALARADSVRALGLFQAIPDTLCIANVCSHEKLIEAQLLAAAGQGRQAGAVLDQWVWRFEGPFFVLGRLEQGRIAEGLGESQKAIEAYQFVIGVWDRPDPPLEPYAREARAGLERVNR
jgi:eukaryotic-like serine/threonine-protein kinase